MMPPFAVSMWPSARTSPRQARAERSLSHAWPPGHDDQVGRLQPTHFAVEILETGREPGELAFTLVGTRGHVDGRCQCGLELLKSSAIAPGFCQIV